MKEKYEIRQIDSWMDEEGLWQYNDSIPVGEFQTAGDPHRAFLSALHKLGFTCKRGMCRVAYDGDYYELQDRKTYEPLFVAAPISF